MLTPTYESIKRDRAAFAREVEYLKETSKDDILDARMESAESAYNTETIKELEEAADMVNKLTTDDEVAQESVEIDRILNANTDLTFNEMIGISK